MAGDLRDLRSHDAEVRPDVTHGWVPFFRLSTAALLLTTTENADAADASTAKEPLSVLQ